MSTHLTEIMEDGETFRWPVVRAYHAVWLQHLEQGRATWDDEATRLKLCRALVWHRMAPSSQPSATPATTTPQALTRGPRHMDPTHPADQACVAYNQVLCTSNVAHPANLHVCSFCLQTAHKLCQHTELTCKHKILRQNGPWGSQAIDCPPPYIACQTLHQAMRGQVAPFKAQLSGYHPTLPTCPLKGQAH